MWGAIVAAWALSLLVGLSFSFPLSASRRILRLLSLLLFRLDYSLFWALCCSLEEICTFQVAEVSRILALAQVSGLMILGLGC